MTAEISKAVKMPDDAGLVRREEDEEKTTVLWYGDSYGYIKQGLPTREGREETGSVARKLFPEYTHEAFFPSR